MKKEWADRWVTALRSGEYKQGKNALRLTIWEWDEEARTNVPNGFKYCCLGVLSDLIIEDEHTPEGIGWDGESLTGTCGNTYDSYPSLEVRDIAGMTRRDPVLFTEEDGDGYKYEITASGANDDHGMSFAQIADYIEKNYEEM